MEERGKSGHFVASCPYRSYDGVSITCQPTGYEQTAPSREQMTIVTHAH